MERSDGAPPRKKARRGKKKSKAERLSRGLNPTTTISPNGNGDGGDTTVSLEALQSLLAAPEATTSVHWDRAQALAIRIATPQARQLLIRSLVFERQAHKAAVHYARRLQITQAELVEVLLEGRDDPLRCLAVARFLSDADAELVDNSTRITQFLVPWLDAHKASSAVAVVEDAGEVEPSPPTLPSAFATAVRLVLQLTATHKKPALVEEKLTLQRELVRRLLAAEGTQESHGHAGIVLQYASSFFSVLQDVAAVGDDGSAHSVEMLPHEAAATERQRRMAIACRVEELLKMLWPDARVVIFGSSATILLLPADDGSAPVTSHDDVDLCVVLPSCPQFLDATAPLVADIKDHLALYLGGRGDDGADVIAVTRARVPIVKWTDAESQLQCDLCVNNLAALWNTQLTIQLTQDPTIRAFSLWMKRWYKIHRHTSGFAAAISSYGMQLLVVCYLQHHGVLPSSVDCEPLTLDAATLEEPELEDAIQKSVAQAVKKAWLSCPPCRTTMSLWSLVVGFFAFYGANAFDFEHNVVSVRAPKVTKSDKQWTRRNWRFSLSIEDPIETSRDLGSLFSRVSLTRFRTALVTMCVKIADASAAEETVTDESRECVLGSLLLADLDSTALDSK